MSMIRTTGKVLLALFALSSVATISVKNSLDEDLQRIERQWTEIHTEAPASMREPSMRQLLDQVETLRERHPEREELQDWERLIASQITAESKFAGWRDEARERARDFNRYDPRA